MDKAQLRSKLLKYGVLALFALFTFLIMLARNPFFDEAHAWMVSKSFTFLELFKIEKFEGHLFLWHTILFPFSKNNLWYPYSMYIINWLFCLAALVIFWNKAPFSNLQKFLITFSYPFLFYFAPVARCYSIGIFFLFLLLSLWNKKVCHPILFSAILVLLINTSAMAIIAGVPLGLIFIYDLIKSKTSAKNKIWPFVILAVGAALVFIQLNGAYHPDAGVLTGKHIFIYKFLLYFGIIDFKCEAEYFLNKITALLILALYFLSFFYFCGSKKVLFFHISTLLLLFGLFIFKYPGAWWHYLFFYIFMISSIWLFKLENIKSDLKIKNAFNLAFTLLLGLFILENFYFPQNNEVYNSKTAKIAEAIEQNGFFASKYKVYALDNFSQSANGVLPYFENAKLYNVMGDLKYSFGEYKNYMQKTDKKDKIDRFFNSFSNDKINIGISDRKMLPVYLGNSAIIAPKLLYEDENFKVYYLWGQKK